MNAQQPITAAPKPQSSFVRRMIDSHSVLGLGFAALIYIVSLTGSFTLFVPEISLWENRGVATASSITPEAASAAAYNAENQLTSGNEILNVIVYAPDEFRPYAAVRLNQRPDRTSKLQSTDWLVNPVTGDLMGEADAPYAHYIEDLHTMLHLPRPWGRYLVGLLGVVMFTLILSGICAHPTIFKDAFKLRLDRNARLAWTDMHNRLSVWGLPFHLVLTFTGAFLGVAGITVAALAFVAFDGDQEQAIAVINGPQPVIGARPMANAPDYASMIRRSEAPDRQFALLVAGNPKDSGNTTSIVYFEDGILSMRSSDIYRNNGEFLEKFGGRGSEIGARIFGAVQPLHYGTFGGYPVKLLYLILALALTYITSTGMMIWFKRKAQQGEPKPKHEAAWRGMTSGLTLSLAVGAFLASIDASILIVPIALATWAVVLVAVFIAPNTIKAVRASMMISAMLFAIAVVLSITGVSGEHPAKMLVNALLLICAVGLAICAIRLEPAPTDQADPAT